MAEATAAGQNNELSDALSCGLCGMAKAKSEFSRAQRKAESDTARRCKPCTDASAPAVAVVAAAQGDQAKPAGAPKATQPAAAATIKPVAQVAPAAPDTRSDAERLTSAQAHRRTGVAAFEAGRFVDAAAAFEAALRDLGVDPSSGKTIGANGSKKAATAPNGERAALMLSCWLNLASCAVKTQRWDEAAAHATLALALEPMSAKALYRRAQARRHAPRKDTIGACADIAAALRLVAPSDALHSVLLDELRELGGSARLAE